MGAGLDLVLGDVHQLRVLALHDEPLELARARDVAPLAHVQEGQAAVVVRVRTDLEVLQAGQPHLRRAQNRQRPRRKVLAGLVDRLDVRRRRAAAPAHHVHPPVLREHHVLARHVRRRVVVAAHRVRQARVRVHVHEALRAVREPLQERLHRLGAQGAIQPDAHGLGVPDRRVEALARLARQRPPALVHERARDEQRDVDARVLQELVHRVHRRLGVQRVEDRLHDQNVCAAVHQPDALLVVRLD